MRGIVKYIEWFNLIKGYDMSENIGISEAHITFTQEGNTLGTTDEVETLTICAEFQLPGEGPFWVIKTEGWSFDDLSEIHNLVTIFGDAIKKITSPT